MLEAFAVDHERLYADLREYMGGFRIEDLDRRALGVLEALRCDRSAVSPGCFDAPPYPEPVIAIDHRVWATATQDSVDFWEHLGAQGAMEIALCDVVSRSICPGVLGHPELDRGPRSTRWWREDAQQRASTDRPPAEAKHLELAKITLNRSPRANQIADRVCSTAEDTLRLFEGAWRCHDAEMVFRSEPYVVAHSQ